MREEYMNDTAKQMMRVALYIRVSSDEQKLHGLSIAAQKQALNEYAKANDLVVYDEYVDEGVSAGAMTKRKQMQRLLNDCRAGKVDMILFTKLDRWFRHVAKYHEIQKELDTLGVVWRAIDEPVFETVTSMGRANINFYLTTAQIEVDRTSERINAILKYKQSHGHALSGRMPIGYKIGEDRKPAIDPDTVHIAKYILTEYENLQSKRKLIDHVKENYGVDISFISVSKMLNNRKYTGFYRGNPDYFPKIISLAQYDRNQEIVKRNIRTSKKSSKPFRTYLFSGLLVCRTCGKKMAGTRPGTSLVYRCNNATQSGRCTNIKRTTESILERNMLEYLKRDLPNIKLRMEKRKEEQKQEIDVDAIKEELKRLNTMFRKGRIDEDEYDAECEILERQLKAASVTIAGPSIELVSLPDFDELYESFTRDERKTFWREIVDFILINGRDFEPHFLV